jgi:hypothetical protein
LGDGDQPVQAGVHLEPVGCADMLERRQRDRRQPHLGPWQRRRGEERQGLAAEYLVADRFVEQVAGRQTDRVPFALVQDALGLEQ